MKKNLYQSLTVLCLLLCLCLQSQAQSFVWAKSMGGTANDEGRSTATDIFGNVYTTGYFQGTVDFDPGTGVSNLTSAGGLDVFVSKLDASGNFLWARRIGGTSDDVGQRMVVDAFGTIHIIGRFQGTVDFDPGAGVFNLTSVGSGDIFVLKLDESGNLIWARSMGGTEFDDGLGIVLDASRNIYITGYFRETADFDPGAAVLNLTSAGDADIFVSKLDASGNLIWARRMGGIGPDFGYGIGVDILGNVYTTGYFRETVDFDPGAEVVNLISAGNNDIFVSKLDASGSFLWARRIGGTSDEVGFALAVDAFGNTYITGYFRGIVDFDPGAGEFNLTSAGGQDIFVSKLDASGSFLWAQRMGGTSSDEARGIVLDDLSNVYTIGYFQTTADFDPGAGVSNLISAGGLDVFVSKLDASGNFIWARCMGGTSDDFGFDLRVDVSENVYIAGYFQATADFDPGTGVFSLTSAGGRDIFVSKLEPCPTITINPATLLAATLGTAYSQALSQTGLTGTPTWSVSAGTLPAGLSLNTSTGLLSGTPTTSGTFSFTVQVTNGSCSATCEYSLLVCPTITINPATLPAATLGTAYSQALSQTGLTGTPTWSVSAGALPAGLSLNTSTGLLSGTPTSTEGSSFTIQVTNGSCSATREYNLSISPPLAVSDKQIAGITIYPNPSTELVYVRFENSYQGKYQIAVIDLLGSVRLQSQVEIAGTGQEVRLELSNLPAGLYMLRLEHAQGSHVAAIIKK